MSTVRDMSSFLKNRNVAVFIAVVVAVQVLLQVSFLSQDCLPSPVTPIGDTPVPLETTADGLPVVSPPSGVDNSDSGTKAKSKYVFSVSTPTARRESCDYIHVLAASMWASTKPEHAGTTVRHWTISSGDQTIEEYTPLALTRTTYGNLFSNGGWWSISVAPDHTKELENLEANLGDSLTRTRWRSKEALDYMAALNAALDAAPDATHVVVIQDDAILAGNWVELMIEYLDQPGATKIANLWSCGVKTTCYSGVGILYEREIARKLTEYIEKRWSSAPVDWIIEDFLKENRLGKSWVVPSAVQHLGIRSSLPGKTQILTGGNWGWGVVGPGITKSQPNANPK